MTVWQNNLIRYGRANAALAIAYAVATPSGRAKLSKAHLIAAEDRELDLDIDEIHIELPPTAEARAMSASIGASGGFTVPEASFVPAWEVALDSLSMRANATIERLDGGGSFNEPTVNDAANEGYIVPENQPVPQARDVAFGLIEHRPIKYSSGRLLFPAELAENAGPSFPAQLARLLGTRIARRQNRSFTMGTGSGDSMGIIPACVQAGATVAAANSTAISPDDLYSLYDKLGAGYFDFERCALMMHKDVLLAIRMLKDASGRPLFRFKDGRLDGFRVVINEHSPSTLANGTDGSIVFGDLSFYHVNDWRTLRLARFAEPHAESDQDLWAAYMRSSGNLVDAGTHPVVALCH